MVNSELVIDFVNTARFDPEREELTTPAALVAWLADHGLQPGSRATTAEYEEARRVREALRAGLAVRFAEGGAGVEPQASGVPGAVGRILAEVSAGMADGTWERLKACRAHDCRYAFLDTAKNRSRAWCSMQSCGNRAKVAAYRERHSA
jgi:predicted RNA-binding Zn ribbon-like protein